MSNKKSNQEIKSNASVTLKLWRFSNKLTSTLFFSHKHLKFRAVFWTKKNLKQWSFKIWLNILFIKTLLRAFRSTRSILVYRVEKSKNCNKSGEALSILDLQRLRLYITSTTLVKSLRIQWLSQGTSAFLSLNTQRSLTIGNVTLKKKQNQLETSVRELKLAAQINLSLIGFYETFKLHKETGNEGYTLHLENYEPY